MNLYNIHTHKIAVRSDRYTEICILNTYPQDFYDKKVDSPNVWYSCGIHPWHIKDIESDISLLKDIAVDDRIVAIGEAGLDKLQGPDMNIQIDVFRKQIELAEEFQKPLIIHCVKAWDELIALRKELGGKVPWIIHGYRGNPQQTEQFSKMGFKFSIGEKFNAESLKNIPLESIFCETDMSENSICQIYSNIEEILGVDRYHFVDIVEENIRVNLKILSK